MDPYRRLNLCTVQYMVELPEITGKKKGRVGGEGIVGFLFTSHVSLWFCKSPFPIPNHTVSLWIHCKTGTSEGNTPVSLRPSLAIHILMMDWAYCFLVGVHMSQDWWTPSHEIVRFLQVRPRLRLCTVLVSKKHHWDGLISFPQLLFFSSGSGAGEAFCSLTQVVEVLAAVPRPPRDLLCRDHHGHICIGRCAHLHVSGFVKGEIHLGLGSSSSSPLAFVGSAQAHL